jgi:Secretion system C-terminal sorting domain
MKITLFIISMLFTSLLSSQNVTFSRLFASDIMQGASYALELPSKDLVLVTTDRTVNGTDSLSAKIFILASNGVIKDSIIFKQPNKNFIIQQLIPTSYGYCLLGQMSENRQVYFWNAKLDKQFRITAQHFEQLGRDVYAIITNYAVSKDSTIPVVIMPFQSGLGSTSFAKIDRFGNLINYKSDFTISTRPNNIVSRNDSLGYLLLGSEIIATDTAFNVLHKRTLAIEEYLTRQGLLSLQPTFLRKNDTSFYCAGRWVNHNARLTQDLVFLATNLRGATKFYTTVEAVRDTNSTQGISVSIDTTKDGRFIYWGGAYNTGPVSGSIFSNLRASFILTKLDTAYRTIWQKKYGGEAYYLMQGVLATSDGGCLMYGRRYDYNTVPKMDAYIIKVDGNGMISSETTIPIGLSSITAYPNPSTGQLNFKKETPSVLRRFEVSIFDISGKLVHQKKETDLSETIDLTHLAEGNYMYQIQQQGVIKAVGKWVKVK